MLANLIIIYAQVFSLFHLLTYLYKDKAQIKTADLIISRFTLSLSNNPRLNPNRYFV